MKDRDVAHFKVMGFILAGLLGASITLQVNILNQEAEQTQAMAINAEELSPIFKMMKTSICIYADAEQRNQLADRGVTCKPSGSIAQIMTSMTATKQAAEQGRTNFNKGMTTHEDKH